MASPSEAKGAKKRVGRKRLPPLPQGSSIQFVIANHPDDFRADQTMRHVRSHVMYKHRGEQQGVSSRDRSKSGERRGKSTVPSRTPSPQTGQKNKALGSNAFLAPPPGNNSWESRWYQYMNQSPSIDPMRNLAARITATITTGGSGTPSFDASEYPFPSYADAPQKDGLDELKNHYVGSADLFCSQDMDWMWTLCSNDMSFLSHVSVACVYRDVREGFLDDTPLTVYVKGEVLSLITNSVSTQTDDFTILSILHLLVSEIGGRNEDALDVHQDGLLRMVHQRGGIANLGLHGKVAAFLAVVILNFSILRGHVEPPMLHGFVPSQQTSNLIQYAPPVSPLYTPRGDVSCLLGKCPEATYQIIAEMHDLTRTFVARWTYTNDMFSPTSETQLASYDAHMQQIYTRLLMRHSTEDHARPDWIYECCRLAALIYCRSIVQGVPFSDSANVLYARSSGAETSNVTLISALHNALEHTDRHEFWGDMRGVLFWVTLVGGAASWQSSTLSYSLGQGIEALSAWERKCFALWTISSSMAHGFEHASAIVQSQRLMLQVQQLIDLKRGIAPH